MLKFRVVCGFEHDLRHGDLDHVEDAARFFAGLQQRRYSTCERRSISSRQDRLDQACDSSWFTGSLLRSIAVRRR